MTERIAPLAALLAQVADPRKSGGRQVRGGCRCGRPTCAAGTGACAGGSVRNAAGLLDRHPLGGLQRRLGRVHVRCPAIAGADAGVGRRERTARPVWIRASR